MYTYKYKVYIQMYMVKICKSRMSPVEDAELGMPPRRTQSCTCTFYVNIVSILGLIQDQEGFFSL